MAGYGSSYKEPVSVKFSAKLGIGNKLFYNLSYRGGLMGTINGNTSNYLLHTVTNELSFMMIKGRSFGAEEAYFNLHGNYRHFADVNKTYPYLKIFVKFTAKI